MNRSRTVRTFGLSLLAAIASAVGGCGHLPQVGMVPISGLDTPGVQDAAPALDIQNHRGSVTVIIDPDAKATTVKAVPRLAGRIEQDARWTAATMALDNGLPVLRVLSTPEDTSTPDVPVEITVIMPRVGGVRVQNDDGPVVLRDVRGAIEVYNSLSAYEGSAIFIQTRHALTDPVLLRAQTGDIEVRMGRGSSGQLIANSGNGNVTVDGARADLTNVSTKRGTYTATINAGENEQRITTDTGNVVVLVGKAN